ncbi:MAG: hypothetical protein PUC98_07255, partial [Clostridiales bacterium]|nr:hypothetical protein [Clostridiales bacterium]
MSKSVSEENMLFRKKKNKNEELKAVSAENTASVGGEADKTGAAKIKSAADIKAAAPVRSAAEARALSQQRIKKNERFASVMARMFRLIVSADLSSNSYYIESGSIRLSGGLLNERGYYDSLLGVAFSRVHSEESERFAAMFQRDALIRLLSERDSISEVFRIQHLEEETEQEITPQTGGAAEETAGSVNVNGQADADAGESENESEPGSEQEVYAEEIKYNRYEIRVDRIASIPEPR